MTIERRSIIDNWSLEAAAFMLDRGLFESATNDTDIHIFLDALSNYINSLLLYDHTNYLDNGFAHVWQEHHWFKQNTELYLQPIDPTELQIDWESKESYADKGIKNYLLSSQYYKTDLFLSAERSGEILSHTPPKLDDSFTVLLKKIDEKIKSEKEVSWFDNVKVGVDSNFMFPSLTHFVLSQASSLEDLLTVIIQMKESNQIKKVRNKIEEITSNTKTAHKFQKDIEKMIKEAFGEEIKKDKSWSVKITVWFLTFTKSFHLDFFNRKEHLLFLKDMIACRSEMNGLKDDISRIYGKSLKLK